MLSAHDRWLTTPPESDVPEMDQADEDRILMDILWETFRRCMHNSPENAFRCWVETELLENEGVGEALFNQHEEEIRKRWAAEHKIDPLDDGDHAYEERREREWEKE